MRRWKVCERLYSECGHTRHRQIPAAEIMPGVGLDGLPLSVEGRRCWLDRFRR